MIETEKFVTKDKTIIAFSARVVYSSPKIYTVSEEFLYFCSKYKLASNVILHVNEFGFHGYGVLFDTIQP